MINNFLSNLDSLNLSETNIIDNELDLSFNLLLKQCNYIIDYKNINLLKYFLNSSGQILSRLETNISLKYHKKITKAIKKARMLKLLPFILEIVE